MSCGTRGYPAIFCLVQNLAFTDPAISPVTECVPLIVRILNPCLGCAYMMDKLLLDSSVQWQSGIFSHLVIHGHGSLTKSVNKSNVVIEVL